MRTQLVVGDWSDDGHGKTEVFQVIHNLASSDSLEDAFVRGSELLEIDMEQIACDYEAPYIYRGQIDKLLKAGFDSDTESFTMPEELDAYGYVEGPEGFINIWLFIAKQGNPDLEYEILPTYKDVINVGGYGLFH